ncbi:MAG: aminotransferase class V-fold PLP-dependent enzyme [Pseudomonadales bacterium]|nr:aminotransferase class V-fold PLP-dependent enzyme [Pseudomonadales bacterium]
MPDSNIWDHEFPLDPSLCYLNHAAVAPWPKRTADAITAFAIENTTKGATHYPRWEVKEKQIRKQLKTLINAPSVDDIALLKNTSEALSIVAHGLKWSRGDQVVISDQEFPSNRIVWESLARYGVEVIEVDLNSADSPESALINAVTKNTRLISISSVQYATGLKVDLNQLGDFCSDNSVLFCVDAIQSIGATVTDVQACKADFMMADGHKWMLGPEGLALFYCSSKVRDQLQLHQYGWHMVEDSGNYDTKEWDVASSARRFECGSPNMLAIHGLSASLSLLLDIGMASIEQQLNQRIDFLLDTLTAVPGIEILSSREPERQTGIVTFKYSKKEQKALHQSLMASGVICAKRGGGIRFSPHFYTPLPVLEKAVEIVKNS